MAFHGLFIGVDRFLFPRIDWLSCAVRDARALHALFSDSLGSGGELLVDEQASLASITERFERLTHCDPEDVVVLSFSGHGSTTHELLTYDADPGDLSRTAVPLAMLAEWVSRIPARLVVCVLDCCFSGGLGAKVFVADATPRSMISAESLLDKISGKGRLVLTAATANQQAWESVRHRHGLLTHHLIQALLGAEEVVEGGRIIVYRLLEYVTRRVTSDASSIGKEQQPTLRGQLDGELSWPVFARGAAYRAAFPGRCTKPATADIASLGNFGFPPELVSAWAGSIPSLNELQLVAINQFGLLEGEHLVVSAPTSSGKTMIGELAALKGVLDRKRACFLFPLRALVNDKHRQFNRVYQPFGLRVIRATGEIADDMPALMRGQYDISLLTYEKFASLALAFPHLLEQLGTIVVDEVQMVADASRGVNLEFLLTLLRMRRESGVEPQLIALSAVIGDTNGLERWLGARLLRRTERPVPLEEGILVADGRFRFLDAAAKEQVRGPIITREYRKNSSQDYVIPLVRKLVGEGKQVIVFRETKGEARGCAGYLARELGLPAAEVALRSLPTNDPSAASQALREALGGGVAFHTSDLDRDERAVVEERFRLPDSEIRVIAATTTLAMGVNTPAEAVVVAGLMHPGNEPYSVAEYKNIVGRAGRLGYSELGTSYLLALDFREEHNFWNHYVKGAPEDLRSRFVVDGADPRSLILRVLAAARNSSVKGIPAADVISFLEGSFGAFQRKMAEDRWSWNREELSAAFSDLEQHQLIEPGHGGHYHLTTLGRFAGEAGVHVESVVRLVDAFRAVSPGDISDPVLITAAQLTVELDDVHFPMNKRSTQKEPTTWLNYLSRQNIPQTLLSTLRRFVAEEHTGTLRAKKASSCLLWISPTPMAGIESALTQHGGFDAAGAVRSAASRTRDLLTAVERVATFLHPGLDLSEQVARLLVRLELGVPGGVVDLARQTGARLARGDYHDLLKAGLADPEAVDEAADEPILACLGGDKEKLRIVREAAAAIAAKPKRAPVPVLPEYEP